MAAPLPSKIGKYDVVGVIGRGGMGVVYRATDPRLARPVAIKMITGAFADDPDMLKRFLREAQSLGSLQHPNIVTVFDLGEYEGNPYLVMEYLEGEGLDSVLANRRPLSLLEKITIVIQMCNGLGCAHRRGVVHRDIKPANIMLGKDGNVKIFDFGIAHAGNDNVTRTGQILGTLRYMAPEQVNSQPIDCRTDIFSTGVVLYQLFTNHLPFEGTNTATTLLKIVQEAPPPLSNFLSVYPADMEQILHRALAKHPEDRYASADEFALDLTQLQGQLKGELIGREMQDAALFLDRGQVDKAQSSLMRVLRIDQHHTSANRLLREVQQLMQRDEAGKQVRDLRDRAEEAAAGEQFEQALEHIDRALGLDRNNTDLQQMRETVRAAALRAEKLRNTLKIAEEAHAEGKLDAAREAAEAALALAPDDTHAKTAYRAISRDLEERSRQNQMEGYLTEARLEMASRRFTAALQVLKLAEELDPAAPQVHSLIESASASRQQQHRHKELEALTHQVEDALNGDDYLTAMQKADEGLTQFPEDRNLLKLKALADRQRGIGERKQFVDEKLATARKLFYAGRNEELQEMLEKALAQIGPEPRLQSLLAAVERQKTEPGGSAFPASPPNGPPAIPSGQTQDQAPFNASPDPSLRDATVYRKADTGTAAVEGGVTALRSGGDELRESWLPIIERQLAPFIGPLAKILVKRAAGKTRNALELYTMLAANLDREEDRRAFLAKRAELTTAEDATTPATKPLPEQPGSPAAASSDGASPGELTAAAVEQSARKLAAYLGPIAPVLARKEAKRASSLRDFYERLAEYIVNPAERERFLTEAGAQKDSPPSDFQSRRHETIGFSTTPADHTRSLAKNEPERKS